MAKTEQFTIRLKVEGGKVVSSELGAIGVEGERTFSKITAAGKGASLMMGDFSRLLNTRLIPALSTGFSVVKIKEYSDAFKGLEGRLKVAVGEGQNLAAVQNDLFNIAQDNSSPLEAVIDAYARLSLALPEVAKEQTDLIEITDLLSKTLLISGASADGAKTFFQQFGQAASNDFKAIGQELQTFADQNNYFYKILQEEAAKYGNSLKDMAKDGALSFQFIVDALNNSKNEIEAGLGNIPVTIEKAFTQLDNAFLKLIGQSDLVNSGTSSIAAGVVTLANNLDLVAEAITYVSVAMGGKFLTSLYLVNAAKGSAIIQTISYQAALARMAGVTPIAATATIGLAGAMRVLSGAMSLIGGPVGVALLGTMALMKDAGDGAADAQAALNTQMGAFQRAATEYASASDDLRQKIESDTAARIEAYKQELIVLDAIASRLENENIIFRFSRQIGSEIGIDTSSSDVRKVSDEVKNAINELEEAQKRFEGIRTGSGLYAPRESSGVNEAGKKSGSKSGLSDAEKQAREIDSVTEALKFQNEQMLRSEKEQAIYNELRKAGTSLNTEAGQEIAALIEEQFALNEMLAQKSDVTEKATKALEDYAKEARNTQGQLANMAMNGVQSLEDSLVGMITGTKSAKEAFSDMATSIIEDLARMQVQKNITGPLSNALSGVFDSIFSATFSLPKFARGGVTDRPSIFGEAGPEAAVPLPDGRRIPVDLGGASAPVMNVVINNNKSDAQVSTRRSNDGKSLEVSIDEIGAKLISSPSSRMNRAMRSMNNSRLVK